MISKEEYEQLVALCNKYKLDITSFPPRYFVTIDNIRYRIVKEGFIGTQDHYNRITTVKGLEDIILDYSFKRQLLE